MCRSGNWLAEVVGAGSSWNERSRKQSKVDLGAVVDLLIHMTRSSSADVGSECHIGGLFQVLQGLLERVGFKAETRSFI